MKSRRNSFLTVLTVALAAAVILTCAFIFADEENASPVVTVAVSDTNGSYVLNYQPVTVTDTDGDGSLTINDALYKAHEAYFPNGDSGYGSAESSFGLYLTKLWGDDSGAFGYYIDNQMAMGLSDPVQDGSVIHAYIYRDQAFWSDVYTFFEEGYALEDLKAGDTLTLTLSCVKFDENYVPVAAPVENASIIINGESSSVTTGADGKFEITLSEGTFEISAASETETLVPPMIKLVVSAADNGNNEKGMITLPERILASEEGLSVTVNLPEDRENAESDWIGVYRADADESSITDMDSLGIWCYIGTNTKNYGVAEGKTLELTVDGDLAQVTTWSDNELHWPLAPGEYKVMLFFNDSYTVEDRFYFTVEEDVSEPTSTPEPAATPEPDVTPEPGTDPTDAPEPTDEPASKKGCGSVVLSSAVVSLIALSGAALLITKKKRG